MFKSLILSVFLSSSVGVCASQPVCAAQPQQVITRDSSTTTTNNDSDTTLYYKTPKYDTNEVNSSSDLIIGNAYYFSIDNTTIDDYFTNNSYFYLKVFNLYDLDLTNYVDNFSIEDFIFYNFDFLYPIYLGFNFDGYNFYIYLPVNNNDDYIIDLYIGNMSDFVFTLKCDVILIDFNADTSYRASSVFSKCENIPYEYIAVPSTHNSNLYTLIFDFYNGLFNSSSLDVVTFSIGNSTMSLNVWLSHTLTIITLFAFVFVLFLLLKWLFKVVSNLILLKN